MGPPTNKVEIKRFEISEVYAHPDANVDIVLVHGLNGDPQRTWTAKNGVFWPADLLPTTLKTIKARVLVYGYNADVWAFGTDKSPSGDMIHQHAQTLVSTLAMDRTVEGVDERPIIWVAHSLGGILVKRVLELSNDLTSKSSDINRSIFVSTYGIIFLGTPHNGADPAKWGEILQKMADVLIPKKAMDSEAFLVKTLKSNNETLQNINLHFLDICGRFEMEMVHEAVKTDLKAGKGYIVDRESAAPPLPGVNYYGIEATHSGMCKFESVNSPGYKSVSGKLLIWARACEPLIHSRWVTERRARQQAKAEEARELMGMYNTADENNITQNNSAVNTPALSNSGIITTSMIHSVASIEPEKVSDIPFIKPPGFRPNSLFVGRETELDDMHRMLFDKRRRSEGTSAVLLQCIPGGGKTHLARQYVYKHLDDFPGGVFWVRAKSAEQLADGFWDIARRVALKPLSDDDKEMGLIRKNPEEFVSIVNEWFQTNQEWLLILDGIQFDHSEEFRRYIPDNKNTSLIYTSTDRNVGGDHHFMNPQVIHLPPLSAREAQELFLLELDKKNPTTADRTNIIDLVQRMEFLPLAIHVVARRLKATGEPLAKFARHYATGPKLRGLETYQAVVEQLKGAHAQEALNLMNTICFFSQHIPVEMIALGLKGLDVPVQAYESVNGSSINNTFKILNRFALIDRNEEPVHSSQTSKGSGDWLSDDVDVIRLHSVVQDYFTDVLRGNGELPLWLRRSVKLFCRSYDYANIRIRSKTNTGLVGDYRSYEIHGHKLREHLSRNEKKFPILKETKETIESYLIEIKNEVKRRTRESSQDLVQGRSGIFQVSIFDRSSSSSDTVETPDTDKNSQRSLTWTSDRVRHDSPLLLENEELFQFPIDISDTQFPLPTFEDRGYDSDRDTVSGTIRPPFSRHSPRIDDNESRHFDSSLSKHIGLSPTLDFKSHRAVRALKKSRYHDAAGAWRAVNPAASDPRVSIETVSAQISSSPPLSHSILSHIRPISRGRSSTLSGMSAAQLELARITRISPPPGRGGGMIQDPRRSRSRRPLSITDSEGRLVIGTSPYANSSVQADTGFATSPSAERSSRDSSPATSAQMSLQRIPYDGPLSPLPPHMLEEVSPRVSPRLGYRLPYPNSDTALYALPGRISQEDLVPSQQNGTAVKLLKRNSPDYVNNPYSEYSQTGEYLPASLPIHSISRRTLATPYFYRQHSKSISFNRDKNLDIATGYTSQPMSRGPSAESASNISVSTEPLPQLPTFSPRIGVPPTSYQTYEETHNRSAKEKWSRVLNLAQERVKYGSRSQSRETERPGKGPRLSLNMDGKENLKMDNLPTLRTRSPFNPTAPQFVPRSRQDHTSASASQLSPLEIPMASSSTHSWYHAPTQFMHPATPTLSPGVPTGSGGFSRSAGFKVENARKIIGFGDFPEVVDVLERRRNRKLVEKENMERERESYRRWREANEDPRRNRATSDPRHRPAGLGIGVGVVNH